MLRDTATTGVWQNSPALPPGTAKDAVSAAIAKSHPIPVRFIGVGEGLDDLRPFVAEDFVAALLELEA